MAILCSPNSHSYILNMIIFRFTNLTIVVIINYLLIIHNLCKQDVVTKITCICIHLGLYVLTFYIVCIDFIAQTPS